MFVSIIQPVYNAEKYLEQTIISVLNQTHKKFEYILIDDGSIDSSLDILNKYSSVDNRIKILKHEKNRGYIEALNYGITISTGEYIFRIDSDDLVTKFALENRISKYFETNNCILVSGLPIYISNLTTYTFKKHLHTNNCEIKWSLLWGNPITHSSAFFSKSDFYQFEGYIELKNLEDWNLWNKFQTKGDIIISDYSDVFYRFHENQSTKSNNLNPSYRNQVTNLIKINLENYIDFSKIKSPENLENILWVLYTDTNLKDITLKLLFQSFNFYMSVKKELQNNNKKLTFYVYLHKLRMISRLKHKLVRIFIVLLYILVNTPKILLLYPYQTSIFIKYLFKRYIFFKKLQSIC
jgi:glycosyltransferase involved in cell wall biosynthesis